MKSLTQNKLFIFLLLFFIFLIPSNVHAYVRKGVGSLNLSTYRYQGSTTTPENELGFALQPQSPIANANNYDLMALKFIKLNFATYNGQTGCTQYLVNSSQTSQGYPYSTSFVCGSTGAGTNIGYYAESNISFRSHINQTGTSTAPGCWFDDSMKGYLICPVSTDFTKISFYFSSMADELSYDFQIDPTFLWLNYESTEIVNGLSNVQQQQVNTVSAIEAQTQQQAQQNAYIQNSNISQAQTNTSDSITVLNDQLTTELSQFSDLTQLVVAPITMFMELNNNVCAPLSLQIPFVNQTAVLPCVKPIMQQYFGGMYSVFTTVIGAILCYWTFVRTVALIKDLVDADNDKIEVVDL